jgi:hypothetical protein
VHGEIAERRCSVEQRLHKDFVRSFENAQYDEESIYYEIRESMMVRPMTVYGRQLSIIRTSCNDNSVDQYEHVQLSLKRLDLNSVQTEEQNTENSSEDEIKRIPNEYATLVKKDTFRCLFKVSFVYLFSSYH